MPNTYYNPMAAGPDNRLATREALAEALRQQQFQREQVQMPGSPPSSGSLLSKDAMDEMKAYSKADAAKSKDPMNLATASDVADRAEGIAMGSGYSPLTVGQNIGNMSWWDRLKDQYGLFGGAGGWGAGGGGGWGAGGGQ